MSEPTEPASGPVLTNEEFVGHYKADIAAREKRIDEAEAKLRKLRKFFAKDGLTAFEQQMLELQQSRLAEMEAKVAEIRKRLRFRTDAAARGGVPGPAAEPGPDDIPLVGTDASDADFANEFRTSIRLWATTVGVAINDVRFAMQGKESSSDLAKLASVVAAVVTVLKEATPVGRALGIAEKFEKLVRYAGHVSKGANVVGAGHEAATRNAKATAKSMDALFVEMKQTIEAVPQDWDSHFQSFAIKWKEENGIPVGQLVPRQAFKSACQTFAERNLPAPQEIKKAMLATALALLQDDELPLVGDTDGDGKAAGYVVVDILATETYDGSYDIDVRGVTLDDAPSGAIEELRSTFGDIAGKSIIHLPMPIRMMVHANHRGLLGGLDFQFYEAWRYASSAGKADFVAEIDRSKNPKSHTLHEEIMTRKIVQDIKVRDLR